MGDGRWDRIYLERRLLGLDSFSLLEPLDLTLQVAVLYLCVRVYTCIWLLLCS